jgi:plasmid stabilization system protein ParE
MKILWTTPAVKDLRELYDYIARDSEVVDGEEIRLIHTWFQPGVRKLV